MSDDRVFNVADRPTRTEFTSQLDEFDSHVRDCLTAVSVAVERATRAFVGRDPSEAARMAEGTELSRSILAQVENEMARAFARQAPVAADLRLMLTVLRVVPALERCMELAGHVAERADFAGRFPPDLVTSFAAMGTLAGAMWERTSVAWVERDPMAAIALDEDDDDLDVLCDEVTERLGRLSSDPVVAIEGRLIVRFYERLGDHAVHIAQRIAYLATGLESVAP